MSDQTPTRRELTDAETRLLSRLADAEWALKHAAGLPLEERLEVARENIQHAGKDAKEVLNAAVKARADLWAQEQALKLAEHDVEKLRRALMNWERILPGGKYEHLSHWTAAKDALRETSDEQ